MRSESHTFLGCQDMSYVISKTISLLQLHLDEWLWGSWYISKFRETCRNHPALISCQNDFMVPNCEPQTSIRQLEAYHTNLRTNYYYNHPICERYPTPTKIFSHAKHIYATCLSINIWVSDGPVPRPIAGAEPNASPLHFRDRFQGGRPRRTDTSAPDRRVAG